uniref:response regulator n=1 Tax=Alistipes sp. TaxID=1872444 RepID=UPI004056620C
MKRRILVVDDEESLCEILKFNLEMEGYMVQTAESAEEVLTLPVKEFDLILLDVMMGPMSGFELANRLKEDPETATIPIIFCTALDSEGDLLHGFELGADDYVSKPYSLREVSARVKSVLRRTGQEEPKEIISWQGLSLDLKRKRCLVDEVEVQLTKKEFELLNFMLQHRGAIFSREEILQQVWPDEVIVLDRTVDVNITRLRKKLGPYSPYITTRQGYGYGFVV